jgi:hypothetical protein
VVLHHLVIVHLVNMIPGEDEDQIRLLLLEGIKVLENGISRPLIPTFVQPLLRRNECDEFPQLATEQIPTQLDVAIQGDGFILGQNVDPPDVGVDAVAEGEVDDPVNAPKGNGRLRPILGQGVEPLPLSSGQTSVSPLQNERGPK